MPRRSRKQARTPSLVQKRPAGNVAPRRDVVASDKEIRASDAFTTLLEKAMQEILAVTYWFEPARHAGPYPVTVRFSGHRVDVQGRLSPGDCFVQDETIEAVVPGSGPVSLTARIRGINPGAWVVTAQVLAPARSVRGKGEQGNATAVAAGSLPPILRWWHRWAQDVSSVATVNTCFLPLARVPGILPGIWGVMVTLGMIVALILQSLVIAREHLMIGSALMISLLAIAVGIIGAKVWYIVLHRRTHRFNGWCIQGFITGAILAAAILLVALHVPIGIFLDATAPGLLLGMAIGRIGCFFAGCCGGPPTASRFGLWCSDQRVGARRIPTQLLESAFVLALGLLVLVAVLSHGPAGGAFFVAGLAAYTLGRQRILRLRAEPRKTRLGGLATSALAALVLIAAVVFLAH